MEWYKSIIRKTNTEIDNRFLVYLLVERQIYKQIIAECPFDIFNVIIVDECISN